MEYQNERHPGFFARNDGRVDALFGSPGLVFVAWRCARGAGSAEGTRPRNGVKSHPLRCHNTEKPAQRFCGSNCGVVLQLAATRGCDRIPPNPRGKALSRHHVGVFMIPEWRRSQHKTSVTPFQDKPFPDGAGAGESSAAQSLELGGLGLAESASVLGHLQ